MSYIASLSERGQLLGGKSHPMDCDARMTCKGQQISPQQQRTCCPGNIVPCEIFASCKPCRQIPGCWNYSCERCGGRAMLEMKLCACRSWQQHGPAPSSLSSLFLSTSPALYTPPWIFLFIFFPPSFLQPGCFFLPFYCSSDLATPLWWSPARRLPPQAV